MHLKSLYLRNFRNWRESLVHFSPTANRILGENGQGKTNLLEAIYLLSTGRSFRTKSLSDLILHGENYFHLKASFFKDGISQTLSVTYQQEKRSVIYNQTQYPNFSNLFGILPSVLFAPSDINIINGNPLERRRFLNIHLMQTDPLYVYHLTRYHRALKQRNALLKQRASDTLSIWEHELSHSAIYLMNKRKELVANLMQIAPEFLTKITEGKDDFSLKYSPSIETTDPSQLHALYEKSREKDMQFKTTHVGPHRDDLSISMKDYAAKGFSSEGQKRSIIAALKCSEWVRLKEKSLHSPILSIDDFGAHLDQKRLELFQGVIENKSQVFLTMPLDISQLPFPEEGKTICIHEGNVSG